MGIHFTDDDFTEVPMSKVTTPRDGAMCMVDTFWITRNGNPLIFTKNGLHSRQCNKNRQVLDNLLPAYPEGCKVTFIPVGYFDHDCNDYI